MSNSLGKKITFFSLIKYTMPTVIMMIFFSLYTIIDGMFVSRFVGSNALSAINIVYPIIFIMIGISVMLATGGSAIVAKSMGEGKSQEAKENFTLITIVAVILGIVISAISLLYIKKIIFALGSTEALYDFCHSYLAIMLLFSPFIILKMYFDYFLVTAGASNLGLISSILGGIINIVLDYIFIVPLNMGIAGAALATCIGYALSSIIGLIYFFRKKNTLHFVKPKFDLNVIKNSCFNGSSEMVTQLSSSVTTILYNLAMIKLLGEDGVASITIILYIQLLLNSAYLGFTSGVSPRISYNYGSNDENQVQKLVKYSYLLIGIFAICSFIFSRAMSHNLISIFVSEGSNLYDISLNGFNIFSFSFLICGFNIFASGLFTAFSNGKVSALISLLRTFIFFVIGMFILPRYLGVNGVWIVVPLAEVATLLISLGYVYKYRRTYMYGNIFSKEVLS